MRWKVQPSLSSMACRFRSASLDLDTVVAGDEVAVDLAFEVGVEALVYLAGRLIDAGGVLAVTDKPAADVIWMQFLGRN